MSQDPLFSEHWYRVRDLRPRLAGDVIVRRHSYRGIPCFVFHRQSTGAYHRMGTNAFQLIADLNGSVTVNEAWQKAIETQGEHAPTQSELIGLIADLHEAELLTVNRKLDAEQLFARAQDSKHKETKQRYLNPLFLRFSLFDPDRILNACQPLACCIFSRKTLFLWAGLIVFALIVLLPRWSNLSYEIASLDLLSANNLLLFLVIFPLIKLLHELAHGFAVKRFGGEVHDLGIALMVFLPIPYVDASAAAILPDKYNRMLVSAAGILAELAFAAIATLVWSFSQGLVHDLALIVMLICGASTLLFNGNPLLKFDGYYVLADALEIPNLADRSRQYLLGLSRHRLFGMELPDLQLADRKEGIWLALYGVLSSAYKLFIMTAIALMLSKKFFFFGTALAIWIVAIMVVLPLFRLLRFVFNAPRSSRSRALFVTASLGAIFIVTVTFLPLPFNTVTKGVVWLPENAIVRTQNLCEVTRLFVKPGETVLPGDSLFLCEDFHLDSERLSVISQLEQLRAARAGLDLTDRVDHKKLGYEIETLQSKLKHTEDNIAKQLVSAQSKGRFYTPDNNKLEGQYLNPGELTAYVVPERERTVRVAIEQADASWFQNNDLTAELLFYEQAGKRQVFTTHVHRQTPQSTLILPSAGLTTAGGGKITADPQGDGRTVLEPVFDIELAWPADAPLVNVGSHVSVVFKHAPKPILSRLLVKAQRAFLGRVDA